MKEAVRGYVVEVKLMCAKYDIAQGVVKKVLRLPDMAIRDNIPVFLEYFNK